MTTLARFVLALGGFASCLALSYAEEPKTPPAPSEERIRELVKKLETPTRKQGDQQPGPPDYPWDPFDYRIQDDAIQELKLAGDAATPALLALLNDKTKPGQARSQTVAVLAYRLRGTRAKLDTKVIDAIKAALNEDDAALRYGIVYQIGHFGLATYRADWEMFKKNAEIEKLSGQPHVKFGAIDLLTTLPPPEERAFRAEVVEALLPEVLACLRDEKPKIAATTAHTLYSFGHPKTGTRELIAALERKEIEVRLRVLQALTRVGKDDPAALEAVLRELEPARYGEHFADVLHAVATFGPKAKVALPVLLKAVSYDPRTPGSAKTCAAAAGALGEIGADAKVAVPKLLDLVKLNPSHESLRSLHDAAVRALGMIGTDASVAVRPLLACLDMKFYAGDGKTDYYAGSREVVLAAIERIDAEMGRKARAEEARRIAEARLWHFRRNQPIEPLPPLPVKP